MPQIPPYHEELENAKTMLIIELLKHPSITPKAIMRKFGTRYPDSDNSEVMALLENKL